VEVVASDFGLGQQSKPSGVEPRPRPEHPIRFGEQVRVAAL
jgi:hypothetical protein